MAGSKPYWYFHICTCGDYRHQHAGPGCLGECNVCGPGKCAHVPEEIRCKKYEYDKEATDPIWGGTRGLPAESAQGEDAYSINVGISDSTPRTDKAAIGFARIMVDRENFNVTEIIPSDFARELERELNRYKALWKACHVKHEAERNRRMELKAALREVLEQIESLDSYELTRDIEPYKAEAVWDHVMERAYKVLTDAPPPEGKDK